MTAQTFIFVHDQQIVLDYIAADKFKQLPDVKYCFLGMRPVDQIERLDNVIIARNLPNNIEHLPNLVAWTGWYAVLHNSYIYADLVNLFEYDVNIVGEWNQPTKPISYFPCKQNEVWWGYGVIHDEVKKVYSWLCVCLLDVLPMTSNYTISKSMAFEFTENLIKMVDSKILDPKHKMAGHIVERAFSMMLSFLQIHQNRLTHLYADSHGTQGRGDRYQQIKSQLL
jgi:hypothetical protein